MSDETTVAPVPAASPIPPAPPPVPLEQRPVDEMPFEGGEATRALLRTCGVAIAEDIEKLGCTGAKAAGLTIEQIGELRLGVGGGGVGLPCYVGIDRFCLAHNTIGGLQEGQAQLHPEQVEFVSRELTPVEKGKVELIEAARRKQGKNLNERLADTGDILSGREMAKGFEAVEGASTESTLRSKGVPLGGGPTAADDVRRGIEAAQRGEISLVPARVLQDWTCSEHEKTNWACRYCAAQAIVEGALVPEYMMDSSHTEDPTVVADNDDARVLRADQVEENIAEHDKEMAVAVRLYARVATFTRRLAREE